jgi:Cys-rich protein (TIGR04453 family)
MADDPIDSGNPVTSLEEEKTMKTLITVLALALAAASMSVQAADEKKPSAQQNKMSECNKEAGEKKLAGDERKAFMSQCLSGGKMTQQEKMTMCNKQAGEKKLAGDERKNFMSSCLSG